MKTIPEEIKKELDEVAEELAGIISEKIYQYISKKGDYSLAMSASDVVKQSILHHFKKLLDEHEII